MKPRAMKLNAHRVLHYYTPEDVERMLAEARAATPAAAVPSREDLLGAIGRGWTHATTKHMPVDVTLAVAIEKEVRAMLAAAQAERAQGAGP